MTRSLIGTWHLVHATASAADGSPLPPPYGGPHAIGLVSFTAEGRMVAVLCDSRPADHLDTAREFVSYCGAYHYDGRELVTQVDATSRPSWLGTEQRRSVSFEDDLLVLRPPLRAYSSAPEQRVLYWKKET